MSADKAGEIIKRAMADRSVYEAMAARESEVWGKLLPDRDESPLVVEDTKAAATLGIFRNCSSLPRVANEKKFRVNQLLARLTRRCDQLGLHVLNDDPQQDFRVSAFITTLVMNYLFTGKFKRTK